MATIALPAEMGDSLMNKAQLSPTLQLLPDRLGPEVLDLRLDHEPEASANYTCEEPTANPADVERTATLCSSASQHGGSTFDSGRPNEPALIGGRAKELTATLLYVPQDFLPSAGAGDERSVSNVTRGLVCIIEHLDDDGHDFVAKEDEGGYERAVTHIADLRTSGCSLGSTDCLTDFKTFVSNDPLGGGKLKFPPLQLWKANDPRDEVQFLDDFEARVKGGTLGSERCLTFGMYIQCPIRKLRVTEMLEACKREGKKPRWANLRNSFLVGTSNISVHVSTTLSRVQNLKQMGDENPEEFLSRLRREKSKLEGLAANTPKAHVVAASLNDDAMIRTFYDGLTLRYRDVRNEVMRRAISTHHAVTAPISTVDELSSFLSVEMVIIKDNDVVDDGDDVDDDEEHASRRKPPSRKRKPCSKTSG
jgi:hypothetical protein